MITLTVEQALIALQGLRDLGQARLSYKLQKEAKRMLYALEQHPGIKSAGDIKIKIAHKYGKDVGGRIEFPSQAAAAIFALEYEPIGSDQVSISEPPLPANFVDKISEAEEAGGPALLTGYQFSAIELLLEVKNDVPSNSGNPHVE